MAPSKTAEKSLSNLAILASNSSFFLYSLLKLLYAFSYLLQTQSFHDASANVNVG